MNPQKTNLNFSAIVHRIDLGNLRAFPCPLQTLPVFGGGVYNLGGLMYSDPESCRTYERGMIKEEKEADRQRKIRLMEVLYPAIDEEVRAAKGRARALITGLIAVTVAIILLVWWSVGRTEQIDMDAIALIESHATSFAYNPKSEATGMFQITPICLEEWNKFHYDDQYGMDALFDKFINYKIAYWYLEVRIPQMLKYYHKPVTIENILWAYNAGIGNVIKGRMPNETKEYLKKYAKLTGGAR